MKVYIVEDQEEHFLLLSAMLKKYKFLKILNKWSSSQPFDLAESEIKSMKPDLLFVDYDLQEEPKNGLLLCERCVTDNMLVIFFSEKRNEANYSSLKIDDAKVIIKNPVDSNNVNIARIAKDSLNIVDEAFLNEAIGWATRKFNRYYSLTLSVKRLRDNSKIEIPLHKIQAICSDGKYSKLFLIGNETIAINHMISEIWIPEDFPLLRCHKKWIVSTLFVEKYFKGLFYIRNSEMCIPVGYSFRHKDSISKLISRLKMTFVHS